MISPLAKPSKPSDPATPTPVAPTPHPRSPITTKPDATRLVQRAELRAVLLRLPGMTTLSAGERRKIADDLEDLCGLVRRVVAMPRAVMAATADPDATDADLFGGAA